MRAPGTLRTIEVFGSIQGEGLRQGEPTIFVRLAGCNLRCGFCDTKRAWGSGREEPVHDIAASVRRIRETLPAEWVCLTGGEPLAQDVRGLVRALKRDAMRVQVETNGTFPPQPGIDWYTVSPKPPRYAVCPELVRKTREVKIVVCRDLKIGEIRRIREAFPRSTPLILQPQSNAAWSMRKAMELVEAACRSGLGGIRISIQLHKVLRIR